MNLRLATLLLISVIAALAIAGAACNTANDPTVTPAATATSAPPPPTSTADTTADLSPVELGGVLYNEKGCAACHGQNGEGKTLGAGIAAPAMPGHTEGQVRRQIRGPIGIMPPFSTEEISNEELDSIVAYVLSFEGGHGHGGEGVDVVQELAMHHWMAIFALEDGNTVEARHHVEHILEAVEGLHANRMQEALQALDADDIKGAQHAVEDMLAGVAEPELTATDMHLRMAVSAMRVDAPEFAIDHLEHIHATAPAELQEQIAAAITLLQADDLHEAEEVLAAILGEDAGDDHADDAHADAPSAELAPLAEALDALGHGDVETAEHEIEEFLEMATGEVKEQVEAALHHLQGGDLHEAEEALAEILGVDAHADTDTSTGDADDAHADAPSAELAPLTEALDALGHGDIEAAIHEIEEFLESAAPGEIKEQVEEALHHLQEGEIHTAEEALAEILGADPHADADASTGDANDAHADAPSAELAPLAEALDALGHSDIEAAIHEIEEFLETASGAKRVKAEEALHSLQEGDIHGAEHVIEELLGETPHAD